MTYDATVYITPVDKGLAIFVKMLGKKCKNICFFFLKKSFIGNRRIYIMALLCIYIVCVYIYNGPTITSLQVS